MENRTIQYGNLIINKNSFEHYLWTDCIEIDNLRKEINGTKEEFRQGVSQDEQNDEIDSNVDEESSVSTYTE